jgi:3D (Asp-Asp-Asp) domain-containing protein
MIPRKYRVLGEKLRTSLPKILSVLIIVGVLGVILKAYSAHITTAEAEVLGATTEETKALAINLEDFPQATAIYELPKYVTLRVDNTEIEGLTFSYTVGDFIKEKGVVVGEYDEISPALDESIYNGLLAEIIRVEKETYTVNEKIPYATKEVEDSTMEDGITKVSQKGVNGSREKTYEKTYKDGKLVETKLISEKVLENSVNEIVLIGTKLVPKTENIGGETITYYKKLWVWATSYDGNCNGCNGTTATGAKLTHGIIAADPKVIPWHTKMYVPGYGFGRMEDTGGALKRATTYGKTHIDLGFEDVKFGWWSARYTWAYLLVE